MLESVILIVVTLVVAKYWWTSVRLALWKRKAEYFLVVKRGKGRAYLTVGAQIAPNEKVIAFVIKPCPPTKCAITPTALRGVSGVIQRGEIAGTGKTIEHGFEFTFVDVFAGLVQRAHYIEVEVNISDVSCFGSVPYHSCLLLWGCVGGVGQVENSPLKASGKNRIWKFLED